MSTQVHRSCKRNFEEMAQGNGPILTTDPQLPLSFAMRQLPQHIETAFWDTTNNNISNNNSNIELKQHHSSNNINSSSNNRNAISSQLYCRNFKRLRSNMNKPSAVSSTNVDINSIDTHDTVNPFLPHYTLQKRNNNGKIKERKFTALEVQRFIDQAVQQRETQLREEFSCTLQKLLQEQYDNLVKHWRSENSTSAHDLTYIS